MKSITGYHCNVQQIIHLESLPDDTFSSTESELSTAVKKPTKKRQRASCEKETGRKSKKGSVPVALMKWLESGKAPQDAPATSAYQSLYSRQVGKKWSVRINKNTENQKFYVDIRNWADSDIYSRGAFIPMELLPRLLAELNELPNQLVGLGYQFE